MDSGTEWKVGYSKEIPKKFFIIEFIREGDDINNWKELITVQNFVRPWSPSSPEDALKAMQAQRETECPGATEWNVIEQTGNSILYEWHAKACAGWPPQHEIAKILDGKYNRFIIHYVAKVPDLSPEKRAEWIKVFSDAAIVGSR